MSWWDTFVGAIATPAWAAGLLQAILGTSLAFAGAFVLVRRQLAHDRALADRQIAAMASNRDEQLRADAATDLGQAVLEVADELLKLDPHELFKKMISGYVYSPPPLDRLGIAEVDAAIALDLDKLVLDFFSNWSQVWGICQREAIRAYSERDELLPYFREDHLKGEFATFEFRIYFASIDTQKDFTLSARALGKGLVRWNGSGASPDFGLGELWRSRTDEQGQLSDYWEEVLRANFRAALVSGRIRTYR